MNYVYILQSVSQPDEFYTGLTNDVRTRLKAHNAGQSPHTSKHKPWRLLSAHWFANADTAVAFERYLKTGSGRAFALKRLR
jgi:predicted GIY-YIG superfamily endonuclease